MADAITVGAFLRAAGIDLVGPPLPSGVVDAGATIRRAAAEILAIPDDGLGRGWPFLHGEADVRYGLYYIAERIDEATATMLREGSPRATHGGANLVQATAACWGLRGLLLDVGDDLLDRAPAGGEWSLRQTLGHILATQVRYAFSTAYALGRLAQPDLPVRPAESLIPAHELSATLGLGGLAPILDRMSDLHHEGLAAIWGLDDWRGLAAPTVWAGFEVNVRFRLHRWAAHFREHAIQIEKTLDVIAAPPREIVRIARDLFRAWGRLEGVVLAHPERAAARADWLADLAGTLRATAVSVRESATPR
ncbi:MAG: hypothetical protein FJ033_01080 [Chloroflexi bacterium]|nr:hypothetical protein [Chloroflexota bacterium]